MAVLVTQPAPDFHAPAVLPDGSITESLQLSTAVEGRYASFERRG